MISDPLPNPSDWFTAYHSPSLMRSAMSQSSVRGMMLPIMIATESLDHGTGFALGVRHWAAGIIVLSRL